MLGVQSLPRPQVVKQLWIYIKDNGLQKPTNKKVIVCDEKLQKVFKAPEIDMFQMNKVLGRCVSSPLLWSKMLMFLVICVLLTSNSLSSNLLGVIYDAALLGW